MNDCVESKVLKAKIDYKVNKLGRVCDHGTTSVLSSFDKTILNSQLTEYYNRNESSVDCHVRGDNLLSVCDETVLYDDTCRSR